MIWLVAFGVFVVGVAVKLLGEEIGTLKKRSREDDDE